MPIGLLGIVSAIVALICGVVAYSYHRKRFDRAETENVEVSAEGFTLSVPVGTIGYKYEEWILPR